MGIAINISCGARLRRLNDDFAHLYSAGCENGDIETFRNGDILLVCKNRCPFFGVCPLLKVLLECRNDNDLKRVIIPLVNKGKPVRDEWSFTDVDDSNPESEAILRTFLPVKGFVINDGRCDRIILLPTFPDLPHSINGTNGGDQRTERRDDGSETGNNNLPL